MRKPIILCILFTTWLMFSVPAQAAPSKAAPADWAWLVDQVESGATSIALPNDIVCDDDTGLYPKEALRIEGNAFSLTGAIIDGGTVIFQDVRLLGTHGVDDENGGAALTLRGTETIAVLSGSTRAEGGRSAMEGEAGGDGVLMTDRGQGLILNNSASASGGIGRIHGGYGVRVEGCDSSVLLTNSATISGSAGIGVGGSGLHAPSCGKLALQEQASITGGISSYAGGHGIHSALCEACGKQASVSLTASTMAIGGVGKDGGHGVLISRSQPGEEPDLSLSGNCMVLAGDGETCGSAVNATNATISYADTPNLIGGRFYQTKAPAILLSSCTVLGDESAVNISESEKTDSYPASDASLIVNQAISQQSNRYEPKIIEDGLSSMELATSLNGFTVERGNVRQVNVSGNNLKIFMYKSELEGRMQFKQYLMEDGQGGTRLVLVATPSDPWPTVEATVAGLRKLESIGITQLAYTCVGPTYHEQVLDLATLLKAVDAYGEENIHRILSGTADDAIIFIQPDGARDYQETLMPEVSRPI